MRDYGFLEAKVDAYLQVLTYVVTWLVMLGVWAVFTGIEGVGFLLVGCALESYNLARLYLNKKFLGKWKL